MKFKFIFLPLVIFSFLSPLQAEERQNPYDFFGKVLSPLADLFKKEPPGPNRAIITEFILEEATNISSDFLRTKFTFALQTPDKFYLRGRLFGEEITLCRNGDDIWAYPKEKFELLLNKIQPFPKAKPGFKLGTLQLPISDEQWALLPVLFRVQDVTDEEKSIINNSRVIDVQLTPEIARGLHADGWSLRLWVMPDYKPAQMQVTTPDWRGLIRFEKLEYVPSLSETFWRPTPEQTGQVLHLDSVRFGQILQAIKREFNREKGDKQNPDS